MAESLVCEETGCRVSSVLNRDVKQFGKKFLFDRNEETCWNSDQGSSQWVMLEFPQTVKVTELQLQFQGGFTGRTCRLEGGRKGASLVEIADFYPEDTNRLQISFRVLGAAIASLGTGSVLGSHPIGYSLSECQPKWLFNCACLDRLSQTSTDVPWRAS
ncbi:nuclear receptor 2C2-associated protein isoform X1 [Scyliorhinus torazame]|uniref:nuclear receptor 2C2-associated protein isoform X1 n=1 Tax=Scyliorhinus torazame TaxID=75743 RepID=UPI003B5BD0BE